MKVVLQDGIKDCGVCCLLSIMRFYGGDVSKEYLRELTNTTKDGVSLYGLMEAARKLGFEAMGVTGKLEDIDVSNLPCIVHFIVHKSYKHFVVLYQINYKKEQVTIMDPAKGKKILSFGEFKLLTSSAYLFLKPIKKLPIIKKKNIIYKNIQFLFKNNKKILLSIIILTFLHFILTIICSFHFKIIYKYSIFFQMSNPIYLISYLIMVIYLFKNLNAYFRNLLLNKWTSIFDFETTSITYRQILLLPYLYYKNRTTGEIISRFKDLNIIRSYISNCFCILSLDIISVLFFIIIMYQYNSLLTKYILLISCLFVLYTCLLNHYKKKLAKDISNKQDVIHSYLINGVSNVDTIKGFHLEKRFIDKFIIHYRFFLEKIYSYTFFYETNSFIKNNSKDLLLTLIYGLGAYSVIQGKMSLENLILYQIFYSYFYGSFQNLLSLIEEYSSYKVALDRVEELFMITKDNFQNNYFYLPYDLKGDIHFTNLNYQVNGKKLFQNLNLDIYMGERILLSGESGSGKSTLFKMLLRYVDIPYHSISINEIDVNHYHLENLRTYITYVTSNEYLFTDTLKNNIVMYKEVSEEQFQKVCEICLIDELIKNHCFGYDTLIEENGFNFSNGERQRIILARSILRESSIYIFDEAFANIDIHKEKKILEGIFDYLKDKTIIVISHRFNNKKLFDRVLKLEDGLIYEST